MLLGHLLGMIAYHQTFSIVVLGNVIIIIADPLEVWQVLIFVPLTHQVQKGNAIDKMEIGPEINSTKTRAGE